MVGDPSRSIQVLNISNVNANGKTVLNDGKLLELIQKYPFLYNVRVRANNDHDYAGWAWKNINAAFNHSYANDPGAGFSTHDLMARWLALKPLIQCLSKAYDMDAIPNSLRKSVIKISTELDNQSSNATVKPYNSNQNLLLQNMCAIAELPSEKKLALEKEVLEFILCSELESKQTTKLDENASREIRQENEEFLNDIGFQQVLLTSITNPETMFCSNQSNYQALQRYSKLKKSLGWVPLKEVDDFITPCSIRLTRINIDDYLPLAQIIQRNKIKNVNSKVGSTGIESPGIFGI